MTRVTLVSGNASRRTDVGVGEQQCWCRGTAMLVSGNMYVGVGRRAFMSGYIHFAHFLHFTHFVHFLRAFYKLYLGTLCTVRTLTWRACIDAFFDALFTHFLRTFYALLVHFLRTLRNLPSLLALYGLFTQFLRTFYALCALYPV